MLHFGTGLHPPRGRRPIQTKPCHVVWELPLPREKESSSDCTQMPLYSGWWHWTFPSANHSAQNIPNNQILVGGINWVLQIHVSPGSSLYFHGLLLWVTICVSLQKVISSSMSTQLPNSTLETSKSTDLLWNIDAKKKRKAPLPPTSIPSHLERSGSWLASLPIPHLIPGLIISVLISVLNLSLMESISGLAPKSQFSPTSEESSIHPASHLNVNKHSFATVHAKY